MVEQRVSSMVEHCVSATNVTGSNLVHVVINFTNIYTCKCISVRLCQTSCLLTKYGMAKQEVLRLLTYEVWCGRRPFISYYIPFFCMRAASAFFLLRKKKREQEQERVRYNKK